MKNLNQITILLIENNSDWLIDVYSSLQEAEFDVLIATGGSEGFCLARRVRPDLIVAETALTDISGVELCRMIRADKYLDATPFILIGELGGQDDAAVEGFIAGADDCFEADCNPQFLASKISRLIELRRSENEIQSDYKMLRRSEQHLALLLEDTSKLISSLEPEADSSASDDPCAPKSKIFFDRSPEQKKQKAEKPLHLLKKNNDALMAWRRSLQIKDADEYGKARRAKVYYEVPS